MTPLEWYEYCLPQGMPVHGTTLPIPGWFAEHNRVKLHELIRKHDIKTVVEVGSFLGLSAVWFAQRVEHVYCVDQWFEGATHESENNLVGTLRRWDLPRDFFSIFRDNVMRSGLWHKITPIKGHSRFVHGEVPVADLVYLDADHSYEGLSFDIGIYAAKARKVLCGDDYTPRFEEDGVTPAFGVIEAVAKLLPDAQHVGPFWWWERK
jgi:hypothetical protein